MKILFEKIWKLSKQLLILTVRESVDVFIMNIQNIMVQAVSSAGTVGNVMIIGNLNFFIRCRYINL